MRWTTAVEIWCCSVGVFVSRREESVDPALDALRDRLAEIIASPPENTDDLVDTLSGLAKLSNQWSEAIQALRAPTRRLIGPAAAASVSVAARRAEESFIELEITLGDALAAQPRALRHP